VHTCNPNIWRLRQEDRKFRANLYNIIRICLKTKQPKEPKRTVEKVALKSVRSSRLTSFLFMFLFLWYFLVCA
jgi:hypothetical protein